MKRFRGTVQVQAAEVLVTLFDETRQSAQYPQVSGTGSVYRLQEKEAQSIVLSQRIAGQNSSFFRGQIFTSSGVSGVKSCVQWS